MQESGDKMQDDVSSNLNIPVFFISWVFPVVVNKVLSWPNLSLVMAYTIWLKYYIESQLC